MPLSYGMQQAILLECCPIPDSLHWFDVAGQRLFPLMATATSYTARYIAYLMSGYPDGADLLGSGGLQKLSNECTVFGILLDYSDDKDSIERKVKEAVEALS